jgi:predicted TIM-barrel fold metal-dependent hydrolase
VEIVDCHTHVVSPDLERHPLDPRDLSGEWYRSAPASAEDLARAMDGAGVARAVLVQGVGAYGYDNRYAADAAEADPARFASACAIDVEAADAVERLRFWIAERGMTGLRLFALSREGPSWLAEASVDPVWNAARSLGARIIVTLLPHQLDELDRALQRHPGTLVSLDHCAFALGDPDTRSRLFELAAHPGLHLKLTTHNLDEAIEHEGSARPLVGALVEAFGAARLMWGSDFCQIHDRPYAALVDLARNACADLAPAHRAAILGGNTDRIWFGGSVGASG